MAYTKITIADKTGKLPGLNTNVRYEKLDRAEKPKITKKVGGKVVEERTVYNDTVLLPGMTRKVVCDDEGNVYSREQVTYWLNDEQVSEKSETKVFEISSFEPLSKYTDEFVIDKYYELSPDTNGHKKDFDKDVARRANLVGMRKLWEYLNANALVARGEFNTSSRGFINSDGYIRAVCFGNAWGLEVGIFSEKKEFRHLEEGIPEAYAATKPAAGQPVKIKRI